MSSVNRATLLGRLGADPEIRNTQSGGKMATFRMATSETWRDKNTGDRRERTEWHTIVVFSEGLCKIVEQYMHKGDQVLVEGMIKTRKWQDQSGQDRYSTEIVLQGFDSKIVLLSGNRRQQGGDSPDDYGSEKPRTTSDNIPMDDEIPF